jgi:hypothetical protein
VTLPDPAIGLPYLRIMPGANLWLVAHTDEPGTSRDDVPAEMIPAIATWLGVEWSPGARLAIGPGQWAIGPARPTMIARLDRPNRPDQTIPLMLSLEREAGQSGAVLLGLARTDLPETVAVAGSLPWLAIWALHWRGSETAIPWPCYSEGPFGEPRLEADTALRTVVLGAWHHPDWTAPADVSWLDAWRARAGELVAPAARRVWPWILGAAGIGVLLYLARRR